MDDNQNEWGDEETLDTKKFRVSPRPHSLPVLQAVSAGFVTEGAEGHSGAPHCCSQLLCKPACGKHTAWSLAGLPRLELSPGCFSGSSFPAVPSVRGAGDAAGHG